MAGRGKKNNIPGIVKTNYGYNARFTSVNGVRVTKHFKNLGEAAEWLRNTQLEDQSIKRDTIDSAARMTIDEWFLQWLEIRIRRRDLKDNTVKYYEGRYKNRVSPVIGKKRLMDVMPYDCEQVMLKAKDRGDANGSLAKIESFIRLLFGEAVRKGLRSSNPMDQVDQIRHNESKEEKKENKKILSFSEQQAFMGVVNQYAHSDDYCFVLYTGLRCGELVGLKWGDIDWEKRTIHICRTMSWDPKLSRFCEGGTKTEKSDRVIPLTDKAYELLKKKRSEHNKVIAMPGTKAAMYSEYVFKGMNGEPVKNSAYNSCLKKICRRINHPPISMHSLRHTFATRCIESNVKPKTLQIWMGHSSLSITMDMYVHVTEEESIQEMQKLVI